MKSHSILVMSTLLLMSACGGSGGSGNGTSGESFASMAQRGNQLFEKYENSDLTPEISMPTSGTATYRGVAAYSDVADVGYIAQNAEVVSNATLTANFSNDSISGKLDNFKDYENTAIPGTVNIRNGKIRGNEIEADLNGSVNLGGRNSSVNGDLAGGFIGPKADAIAGAVAADVSNYGTIYGILGAER